MPEPIDSRPEGAGRAILHLDFEAALDADYDHDVGMVCIKVWLDDHDPAKLFVTNSEAATLAARLSAAVAKSSKAADE